MLKLNGAPLLVEVHDGRYDCYGDPTPRSRFLFKELQKMGGVNEEVPDGFYHFNIQRRGFKIIASLEPYEEKI